jgi:hypothetical protein
MSDSDNPVCRAPLNELETGLSFKQQSALYKLLRSNHQTFLRKAAGKPEDLRVVRELVARCCDELCDAFLRGREAVMRYVMGGGDVPSGLHLVRPGDSAATSEANLGGATPAVYGNYFAVTIKSVLDGGFVDADDGRCKVQRHRFKTNLLLSLTKEERADPMLPVVVSYTGVTTKIGGSILMRKEQGHMKNDGTAETLQTLMRTGGQVSTVCLFGEDQLRAVALQCPKTRLIDIAYMAEAFQMAMQYSSVYDGGGANVAEGSVIWGAISTRAKEDRDEAADQVDGVALPFPTHAR